MRHNNCPSSLGTMVLRTNQAVYRAYINWHDCALDLHSLTTHSTTTTSNHSNSSCLKLDANPSPTRPVLLSSPILRRPRTLLAAARVCNSSDFRPFSTEQLGDTVKGNLDSAASTFQPNETKSDSQKVGDTLSGNS
jgi:hypothetical protein